MNYRIHIMCNNWIRFTQIEFTRLFNNPEFMKPEEEGNQYELKTFLKSRNTVKRIFDDLNLPNVVGKVWTTDAIYRETKSKFEARKNEGCLAIEIEKRISRQF
ncbi:MAG: hypothetical protein ACI4ES_14915 [Roseburia sp.]